MPILAYIAFGAILFAMLVGGFNYRNLPRALRILVWLLSFNVVLTTVERILGMNNIKNLWMMHISTAVEYLLFFFIFYIWIEFSRTRLVLKTALVLFSCLWIISKFTFEPFSQADDLTAAVSKVIQIFFSSLLLVDVIKESDIVWKKDSRFWIASGTIIYCSGTIFLFALFNPMLAASRELLKTVYMINWILVILANVFYSIGFLCRK
jgi:hypothetical protein